MACSRCATYLSMSEDIKKLREEIDRIDDAIADALDRRAGIAKKIGAAKGGNGAYRPERETEILLRICAEIELRVQQNFLSKEKDLSSVRKIYSHAQSLAQCNGWLTKNLPSVERIPVASNAEAARRAAAEGGAAAIAGEAAGTRYGLGALARSIEDDPTNTTRFLVLGRLDPAPTGKDRTSLVMSA